MRLRFMGKMANAGTNRFGGLMTALGVFTVTVHRVRDRLHPDRRKRYDDEPFQYEPSQLHKSARFIAYRRCAVKREMSLIVIG